MCSVKREFSQKYVMDGGHPTIKREEVKVP